MDHDRIDRLARRVHQVRTRRATVLLTVGALTAAANLRPVQAVETCAHVGAGCGRAGDLICCSGVCKPKKHTPKRACRRAPHDGICTILENRCAGDSTACGTGISGDCRCYVTTAGQSLCGNNQYACLAVGPCASDADCAAAGLAGATCVQGGGACRDTPGDACSVSFCVDPCDHPKKR
jgi:hypothetical protein